ncbi:MAG TPA: HAD-IC family P-type ATPase [Thermomicrobiales bacterium]|nr:HAD-IC family P-type ATPase [Thermomicrobiales bacterium]
MRQPETTTGDLVTDAAVRPTSGPPATDPERGLTEAEAAVRRAGGQGNAVAARASQTYRQIVRRNALTFINAVLGGLGLTLLALGHRNDAFSTVVIMALNVLVGTVQEVYAKRRLDRIALLARPTATVVRDGRERAIDPADVVRGDLLVARAGDQLVADGPLAVGGLEVDEALLTGESDPAPKRPGDPVFAGTVCVAGAARYEARAVGAARVATRLATEARAERRVQTPLQREIDLVIRLVLLLVAQLGLLLALAARLQRVPLAESVQMAAVVAGLVPNGLILTIAAAYAIGALRMAGKGALVQRANAVESLSHVDTLCLDKTGTLTANRLRLVETRPLGVADGDFRAALADYAATTAAPNRTIAAVAAALPSRPRPLRDEAPFTSGRQWSALALGGDGGGVYVLGAPEALRPALATGDDLDGAAATWTARGWRVLLLARGPADAPLADAAGRPRLPGPLVPLGLAAFGDELRPEAAATLRGFVRAGVRLKLISGDHPRTVAALARQAGFPGADAAVAGGDLDALDDDGLARVAEETAVFGRVTPRQKARLVRALRRRGHYVAMVGDGVNDVLALKEAQLGVAMQGGSQAARGVADLILLKDSFAALVPALGEGQRIIGGMQDIFRLFLTRIAYETLVIVGAAVVGVPFPFVPPQIALLTLLTVGLPSFALAWWARPGPPPAGAVRALARFVLPAAWSLGALGLVVYLAHVLRGADTAVARTALTTVTLLGGLLLIPCARPPVATGDGRRGDWRPTALAVALLGASIGVVVTPALSRFFELAPLPAWEYALLAVAVLAWGAALVWGWRARWYDRLLGLGPA